MTELSICSKPKVERVCKNCDWCKFVKRTNNYPTWFCTRFPHWLELLSSANICVSRHDHYCGEFKEREE